MRAVFDTDVVLSALVFGRRLRWLRRAWADGTVAPIVCRETVTELLRVLACASGAAFLVSWYADLTVLAAAYPVISPAMLRERLGATR